MHVCHFSDSSVEGDYFRNIAAGLTERGVRVSLIQLGGGQGPKWLSDFPAVTFLSLNASSKLAYPRAIRSLIRFLDDEHVDILHTHLFFPGLIGVLAKRFNRETIVALMRHHTDSVRRLGSRLHVAADKWMAEKADHVLTVSNAAREYMTDIDGIKRGDIEVVYLGFDFERLSPNEENRTRVRDKFGIGSDEFTIGYVGNLINGKGHVQLIEAFEAIAAEIPNARLFFVGRGQLAEVEAAAGKLASGKIIFAGWRTDVPACLKAMDLFVQPSLSEAFSQVLIEAMGAGLPVIATDVGGANEVIESGVNGILIEPDDTEAIRREVVGLYRDRDRRKKMAEAGMRSVRERFTAEQMVERQYALYRDWMGQN